MEIRDGIGEQLAELHWIDPQPLERHKVRADSSSQHGQPWAPYSVQNVGSQQPTHRSEPRWRGKATLTITATAGRISMRSVCLSYKEPLRMSR